MFENVQAPAVRVRFLVPLDDVQQGEVRRLPWVVVAPLLERQMVEVVTDAN